MNHSTADLNSSELETFAQQNDVPYLIPIRSLSDSGIAKIEIALKALIEDRP